MESLISHVRRRGGSIRIRPVGHRPVPTLFLSDGQDPIFAPLGVVTIIRAAALILPMLGKMGLRERHGLFAEDHSQ